MTAADLDNVEERIQALDTMEQKARKKRPCVPDSVEFRHNYDRLVHQGVTDKEDIKYHQALHDLHELREEKTETLYNL
jgi:hypothetical protein